jgi:Flp pilus assembly protein TadG
VTRRRRAAQGDAGYSIVEAAIVLPVVVLLSMLVVQWALIWHGRHVAEAAAQTGLRTARGYQATAGAGEQAATGYLSAVAPNLLTAPSVEVTRTPTTATVRVHARVLAVIPGLSAVVSGGVDIEETASGPIERFVAP